MSNDLAKIFALCTPFFLFLFVQNPSWFKAIYLTSSFLGVYVWVKEYRENKVRKRVWGEIVETVGFIGGVK